MSSRTRLIIIATVLVAIVVGCAPKMIAATVAPATAPPAAEYALQEAPKAPALPTQAPPANIAPTAVVYQTGADMVLVSGQDTNRMIVKNGEIELLVKDTDIAIDRTTQVVGDVGGYIVSSRVWYQDWYGQNYKYATITIGVPVDQFENALRRLRGLAIRVVNESASGEDVTDEYVDLQSQLGNLEATRDRIRSFLDRAKTVQEALEVNQQLSEIEGQIEKIKGRMNYLSNRSAYSTITVQIAPDLPQVTPTMTPTPTPTRTPTATPTPIPWNPSKTFKQAGNALASIYKGLADFLIWVGVVILPILAPPALVIWGIVYLARRKPKKKS